MSTPDPPSAEPPPPEPPSRAHALREVAGVMLRLGATAFGGPAAHIAILDDEVVRRRRWVTEGEFLDLLATSGLIPGPTSTELCIHLGMARAGVAGLWVGGFCFITPAVLLTLLFAWAYVEWGALPAAQGMLFGLKPAVVAILLAAVLKLARTAAKSVPLAALGIVCLALYLLGGSEVALLLGSGVVGMLLAGMQGAPRVSAACLLFSGAPALLAGAVAAPTVRVNWTELFFYFLKIGSVLFGSGYVLLAFVRQGLVHELHWLTEQQLLDAVAAGQFTPGPLFSTAAFVGYVVGGWQGAVAASVGIFLPSFLLVWVTHPLVKRLREARWSAGFLDGLNAGSVALMAGVLVQLARAALGGHWTAWLILAGAAALQFRTRINSAWIVVLAALVGLLLHR